MTTAMIHVDFCIRMQCCWSFTVMHKPLDLCLVAGYWSVFGQRCRECYLPPLLQGSDIIAFQASIFIAESCLTVGYEVYYEHLTGIGECCLFLMRVEIIGISACENLVGISIASIIKWTILVFFQNMKEDFPVGSFEFCI